MIGRQLSVDIRNSYTLNSTIVGVEDADAVLIVGCNPRHEAAGLNVRLRKSWLKYTMDVALIGEAVRLTYDFDHIGTTLSALT